MSFHLSPIKASRKLLAVLAAHDTNAFADLLHPDASLQIMSDGRCDVYYSSSDVFQALCSMAHTLSQPTINVQSWDEVDGTATVSFAIWVQEPCFSSSNEHVLTVALRDEQIGAITLCDRQVTELVA